MSLKSKVKSFVFCFITQNSKLLTHNLKNYSLNFIKAKPA